MARRAKKSVKEYSTELPEGCHITHEAPFAQYRLAVQVPGVPPPYGRVVVNVPEPQVYAWKHPERVFGHVARRTIRETQRGERKAEKEPPKEEEEGC